MTPKQEQAVRELREAIEQSLPRSIQENLKSLTLVLSQTQSALEQAQRERDEAKRESLISQEAFENEQVNLLASEAAGASLRDFILALHYDEVGHLDAWPSQARWQKLISSSTCGQSILAELERKTKALEFVRDECDDERMCKCAREALKETKP